MTSQILPPLTFVLGGASSGKSAYGEQKVNGSGRNRVYIATSRIFDEEMRNKVADHIADRGPGWRTIEEPINIPAALSTCTSDDVVLIDCATMWLTNVMLDELDDIAQTDLLLAALKAAPCPVVIVSNEVGQGIVPDNKLARRFRTAQGRLNAQLAAAADVAVLVTAGLPLALKGQLP